MPSQALAGPDQVICGPTEVVTMAGNALAGLETGLWEKISGPVSFTITDDQSPTTSISNLEPGTYIFRWSHVIGSCSSADEMQVTVYPTTTAADAGVDQNLCAASSFTMSANLTAAGETGTWTRVSGSQ